MKDYAKEARKLKESGTTCSNSIYNVFKDDLNINSSPPAPRSIEGKCGALLTTEFILKELGKDNYIEEYNKMFLEKFKYNKCFDLMKKERRCCDYVEESAKYICKIIDK